MILYYLKKLLQFFFPHSYFITSSLTLVSSSVCRASENQSDEKKKSCVFFKLPLRLSMLQIFLCFFLQMLSPCYALASVAKPISCDRLRCLRRLHHKGTESGPTIIPYNVLHHLSEEGQIYNSALNFGPCGGSYSEECSELLGRVFFSPGYTMALVH